MSKETIWSFTCRDCENWWSYATDSHWFPRRPLFCPHCGEPHPPQYLQGASNNGRNPKELSKYFSKDEVRESIINDTGTYGQVELIMSAGGGVKERLFCSIRMAESLAKDWVSYCAQHADHK